MLTYFISGSNGYTLRTSQTTGNAFTMSLQDMTRLTNTTASLSNISYNKCESMLSFSASISGAVVGEEYRATLTSGSTILWNGSIQAYASQSVTKPEYNTQNDGFTSHPSQNEYVIID